MTLLALDTTTQHIPNVISLTAARRLRGLPVVPDALPITHHYQPLDYVLVIGAQRRAKVVSVTETEGGGQLCDVMFIEGTKSQEWRATFQPFQLLLITRSGPLPIHVPARQSTYQPDPGGSAA